uniref:Putative pleckstrin similarity domain protein n=1 Tax=Culex tarsalis TaxID=7177 RepID=A0A1Q3G2Q5_CULTA
MKINEKNLCMFATSPPVDLEGWLNKRGEVNKSWQRRWFVLKGNLLFYFERKGDREPLGMIILEGCTVELAEEGEQYCFQIIFHGPNNRTYYLSTESQGNMEQWMKALTCAGYDYMKLMVAELQRQLDEIEDGGCKATPEGSPLPPPPPKAPPRRQNPGFQHRPTVPPIEYASNAEFVASDASTVLPSPKVIRRAPPAPIPAIHQHHHRSEAVNLELRSAAATTTGSEPTSQLNVVDLLNLAGDQQKDPPAPSDEFSFERMHSLLGAPVLVHLRTRKTAMEKSEQPLISF